MARDLRLPAGGLVLALFVLAALAAPWVAPESGGEDDGLLPSPNRVSLGAILQPPGPGRWLGTDGLGRDVAARMLHGARVSLAVGALSAALALGVGGLLGGLGGYLRGWVDGLVMRLVEAVLCLPTLILAMAVLATAPPALDRLPEPVRLALVLGLTGWVPVARYLRGEFFRLRRTLMILSARASGAGHLRLIARHLVPSSLAPVLVSTAFAVGGAILTEATLSFLGLGVRPPTPSWGALLAEARVHVHRAWWMVVFPGAAVTLVVLACNLVGEGIRDRLDPRLQ